MNSKEGLAILFRYALLFVLAIGNLFLFYLVFTPLTVYPVTFILNLIYHNAVLLPGNTIFFSNNYIELITACIAGAAYYLLTILNLVTPMPIKTRIKSLSFIFLTFLIVNILRIVLFSVLLANNFKYFDIAHEITWYLGSTIILILVWFVNVKIFKINNIPIYTDFRSIFKDTKRRKKR